ncbi:aldose 1-epimerase [Commensalibacter oyaizuii]|uniref:Aldose 1-epimerase n=1 Tax=Commensalibacter oyaizuii TaxID=3043873 RepID=A0ABT6PYQ6_9PROT|nr:aldose 1-epimerase [Commensalibacter sp. TBRC 16381]MDI2089991.1 aldose 1-epimerase [Commensalibacter sp. TBRC 16381]
MLEIKSGDNRVGIYPALGGSIAYWLRRDIPVFYPIVNSHLASRSKQIIAAYPLLPYSNRIANGQFQFENRSYQLDLNAANGKDSIHGNAWQREWSLEALTEKTVTLSLTHEPNGEFSGQWPFSYFAKIVYALSENGLAVHLSFKNTDHEKQPVGLGFHPYFPRRDQVEVGFTARSVWNNGTDGLPQGRMSIEGNWSFEKMQVLKKDTVLDNCYAGWDRFAFIRWKYSHAYLTMTCSQIFKHLVVFTPENQPYFTLEPASNMNNGINMPEISDRGLTILKPDQELRGDIFYSFTGV